MNERRQSHELTDEEIISNVTEVTSAISDDNKDVDEYDDDDDNVQVPTHSEEIQHNL